MIAQSKAVFFWRFGDAGRRVIIYYDMCFGFFGFCLDDSLVDRNA